MDYILSIAPMESQEWETCCSRKTKKLFRTHWNLRTARPLDATACLSTGTLALHIFRANEVTCEVDVYEETTWIQAADVVCRSVAIPWAGTVKLGKTEG